MNGLMQKYKNSLNNTPGPILLKDMPRMVVDYRGLIKYANEKGVRPLDLTENEKRRFILAD